MLAFLVDAYHEEDVKGEKRVVLRLHRELAPTKIAVLPLLKKRDDIVATARKICDELRESWVSVYDDTAAIGKLYRRQDEVGTPFCVTVDVQTVGDAEKNEAADKKVTIRERDSMSQIQGPDRGAPHRDARPHGRPLGAGRARTRRAVPRALISTKVSRPNSSAARSPRPAAPLPLNGR